MQTPVCPSLSPLSVSFCVSQETWREASPPCCPSGSVASRASTGPRRVCLGAKLNLIESGDVAQLGLSFCVSVDLLSAKVFNQESQAFI